MWRSQLSLNRVQSVDVVFRSLFTWYATLRTRCFTGNLFPLRPEPVAGENVSIEKERSQTDWIRFYLLLAISVVMATLGLSRNSVAVVIAAMLIAPLMSPILDIASTIIMGWTVRVLRLLLAIFIASLLTIALSFSIPYVVDAPRGMLIPVQVMERTDPGLEELFIALAAGIAGAYVQMRRKEAALLPGVAIGVSLVPPLSAAGLLLYFGEAVLAWEAVLLYLTNLAAIVLSACVVFLGFGLRPVMREKGYAVRVGVGTMSMFIVVALIALDLGRHTVKRFEESRDEALVIVAANDWIGSQPVEIDRVDVGSDVVEINLIFDVPLNFSYDQKAPNDMVHAGLDEHILAQKIREILGRHVKTIFSGQLRYTGIVNPPLAK